MEKPASFYKQWKAQDDEHRKRAAVFQQTKRINEKTKDKIKFYPVKNVGNTGEEYLYQGTWVAEVTMVYEDGDSIRRYMNKQQIVRGIQKNKALVQMYSPGSEFEDLDPDGLLKKQCRANVRKLEER